MEPSQHTPAPDHSHDDGHAPVDFAKTIRTYVKVGVTLIVFTGITWAAAFWDTGHHSLNLAIGLAIATFKVSLVALIFMHLNHERGLIYKVLLFTLIFAAAMMFLFILGLLDPIPAGLP